MTFAMQQFRLALWAAICLTAAGLAMHQCEPAPAYADEPHRIAACHWTPLAGIALARLVAHEGPSDVLPIAETVRNRWLAHGAGRGESFADSVISTADFLRRARWAMEREASMETAGASRRYESIRASLDAWAVGDARVECRGYAFQWRARWVRTRMKRVDCGASANSFVEHPEPFQTRSVAALLSRGEPRCP
jgi:hypothetical protein